MYTCAFVPNTRAYVLRDLTSIFYFDFFITTRANPPSFNMDCPSSHPRKRSALFDLSNEPARHATKKQSCSQFCDHFHGCVCPAELMPVVPHVQDFVIDEEEHVSQTIHPRLLRYFPSSGGLKMSHDDMAALLTREDETVLLDFLGTMA